MEIDAQKASRAEINRLNALKSTGPNTEAGKLKASLNALRHGHWPDRRPPHRGARAIQPLHPGLPRGLHPNCMLEEQLAQFIADDAWRLHRARAVDNNLFALGIDEKAESIQTENSAVQVALAMAQALREQTQALSTLSMHIPRISRQFERNVEQLRKLQAERREREQFDLLQAGKLLELHEAEQKLRLSIEAPEAYHPADDDFVFTVAEIETFLDGKYRHEQADDHWYGRKKAA